MWIDILSDLLFGFGGGVFGGWVINAVLDRRAAEEVGEYDLPDEPRHFENETRGSL